MGRNLTSQPSATTVSVTAGAAISNEALVEWRPDGKAYPVTDGLISTYANINSAITSEITVNASYTSVMARSAILKHPNGNIYTVANTNSYSGIKIYSYTATGTALSNTNALDTGGTYNTYGQYLFALSNGNILVVWADNSSGQKLLFAILDPLLNVVVARTTIGNGPYGLTIGVTLLSSGGFAVVYDDYSSNTLVRLATFDNSGNAVLAPTTIRTKTAGGAYCWVAQLSDGNLAVAVSGSDGQYYGVVTTSGTSVLSFTQLSSLSGVNWMELSVLTGTFCVNAFGTSTLYTRVVSNAGTTLGTASYGVSGYTDWPSHKLCNDGSSTYYSLFSYSTTSKLSFLTMPASGSGYSVTTLNSSGTGYSHSVDGFYLNGTIVAATFNNASGAPNYSVTNTNGTVVLAATSLGASNTTGVRNVACIDAGNGSMLANWSWESSYSSRFARRKVVNSAILGVACQTVAANQALSVDIGAGAYRINTLTMTAPVAFDHSATTILGNKGQIMPSGLVLKGI